MAIGYFIRRGDKTTCGGVVLEADTQVMMFGIAHARQGDRVSCGKDGKTYLILGGVPFIKSHGRIVAGTLHSISGCPCKARLIPSLYSATYQSDEGAAKPTSSPAAVRMPLAAAPLAKPPNPAPRRFLEEEEEEEELDEAGIVLHLGLFFDGTGNNRANSEAAAGCYAVNVGMTEDIAEDIRQHCATYGYDGQGNSPDNSYGNDLSNIARLYELYPDNADERLSPNAEEAYLKVYLEGIGTTSGQADSLYSQATGRGSTGIAARVKEAPGLVLRQLRLLRDNNPGLKIRRIEIDLFGFSRGAAAARHCANDLLTGAGSLLARALPAGSPLLVPSFSWRHPTDFLLNFIGLFDTVPGIVSPLRGDFSASNARNEGLDLGLAPDCARQVAQLVAHHEYRHNFSLVRTDRDIAMPGSHSDIGGGYLPLATEKLLLSRPDTSLSPEQLADERSDAYWRTRMRLSQEGRHWKLAVPPEGLKIVTWSVPGLYRERDEPRKKRVYAAVSGERQVRGELSRVYLRIMRELAVRAGVAFAPIDPEDNRTAVPSELESIAAKLQAFALGETVTPNLSNAELDLLHRHYIHLSAHWNAAKGWKNSDLETVFINRPTKDGKRVIHPNA
ncbi:PAAR domain-containing protein [Metapseudomonas furukawaii]|uniref:VgrG protein n=1 Tax=Metapseudomonas furukawaii TaxID=1149133 RepID=A0AAD1C2K8_METFU|nr:DUF2235 domain-containing protein [Pseudomonas furukawaii]ELS24150.1 VgrG protein [Pseudomonas furukawaii]BAU74932.1 VgrG protein [Pseudomonas furukawaii]